MSTPATRKQKIGLGLLLLALLGSGVLSLLHGGAAAWVTAQTLQARWTVAEWRDERGPVPTPEKWKEVRDDLWLGAHALPSFAALHEDLGYLHAMQALTVRTLQPGTQEFAYRQSLLAEAANNYRQATQDRPTFPYAWAYLAFAKHLRGDVDDEMFAAMDKALRYGKNEGGVQQTLAEVAFGNWDQLGKERQAAVKDMVAVSHSRVRSILLEIAQGNGVNLN